MGICNKFIKLFLLIGFNITLSFSLSISNKNEKCSFEISSKSRIMFQNFAGIPIKPLTREENSDKFLINSHESFEVKCSNEETARKYECIHGNFVKDIVDGKIKNLNIDSECEIDKKARNSRAETIYRNGTCYNQFTNIEIVFNDVATPYNFMTICHDESRSETLYVKSYIRGADLDSGESINRPSFQESIFYPSINTDECYKTANQLVTVGELLGSASLAEYYIKANLNLFMSRGHLSPNGDGIEAFEKRATFYFVNAVPQWQTSNGGNWNQLEIRARDIASSRQSTLTIYTGVYGVTTLDDVNGNPVEIWLGRDELTGELVKKLPCPHLMWKVIHDEVEDEAIAIVQINNPYATANENEFLCEDICNQVPWVDWALKDMRLGYTYCCRVADFAKSLPYAPNLGDLPLLL